jgi:hypothetical protein
VAGGASGWCVKFGFQATLGGVIVIGWQRLGEDSRFRELFQIGLLLGAISLFLWRHLLHKFKCHSKC